jgi:hypothetical protein
MIPERCHACGSKGKLVAYKEIYLCVACIDDDNPYTDREIEEYQDWYYNQSGEN